MQSQDCASGYFCGFFGACRQAEAHGGAGAWAGEREHGQASERARGGVRAARERAGECLAVPGMRECLRGTMKPIHKVRSWEGPAIARHTAQLLMESIIAKRAAFVEFRFSRKPAEDALATLLSSPQQSSCNLSEIQSALLQTNLPETEQQRKAFHSSVDSTAFKACVGSQIHSVRLTPACRDRKQVQKRVPGSDGQY